MPTPAGEIKKTLLSIFSLIGPVLSISRQKMDGAKPSEMDIKVYNPTSTFYLQAKQMYNP